MHLLVIALSNAVPNPRAVMVELLHTVIAIVAVGSSWRPEQLTSTTESDFLWMSDERESIHATCFDILFSEYSSLFIEPFLRESRETDLPFEGLSQDP